MGVSRSTFYAWKPKLERYGLDGLRVRERQRPRMPNQIGPHLEHRIVAFALGHPGFGPRRISAELKQHETEMRCYIRDPDGYLIEVGQTTLPRGRRPPS